MVEMCRKCKIVLYIGTVTLISQIITIIWTIALSVLSTKSSRVIESNDQKGLYISDYCPKMENCPEGSHVMCMYYDPNHRMGPQCSNAHNVSITPELASKILNLCNTIRSKIALGKEKGKDGRYLPRGYGIFRLKWDEELATFAQVLANTCILRHDLCRATKRFPNPGQVAGLVRFSYPDWYPISNGASMNTSGLSTAKMSHAVSQALKSWYLQKTVVSPEMITSYPDWKWKPGMSQNLYLEMIYARATHMGCGVSAYTEYAYHNNNADLIYNSIQIICNYSARPQKGTPVYNTTLPNEEHSPCGCPIDADEDEDCLCLENQKKTVTAPPTTTTTKLTLNSCQEGDENCNPPVVLLPIFTVEDAPPQKLIQRQGQRKISTNIDDNNSMDIFHADENEIFNGRSPLEPIAPSIEPPLGLDPVMRHNRPMNVKKQVKHRSFDKNSVIPEQYYHKTQSLRQGSGHVQQNKFQSHVSPKHSIFSKAPKFELPLGRSVLDHRRSVDDYSIVPRKTKPIKKDVAPRKDFSGVRNLVTNYLNKIKTHPEIPSKNSYGSYKEHLIDFKPEDLKNIVVDEVYTITAMPKDIKYNRYFKQKFHFDGFNGSKEETIRNHDIQNSNDDVDKKLMTLLDTLEQEVKHIELKSNEKQIFDEKIRKIYGNVIGKPVYFNISKETKIEPDVNGNHIKSVYYLDNKSNVNDLASKNIDYFNLDKIAKENYGNRNHSVDKYNKEIYSDFNYNKLPMSRNQNSLMPLENKPVISFKDYKNTDKQESEYDLVKSIKPMVNDEFFRSVNFRNRHTYKTEDLDVRKRHHKNKDIERVMERNYYLNNGLDDDLLNFERRKYYQEKLNNIERKLHSARGYTRQSINEGNDRQLRPVRPNRDDVQMRPDKSKNQISPFMPDRARFLHSF